MSSMTDGPALITHPVIAGSGRPLFEPGDPHTRLELVDSAVSSRVDMADRSRLRWWGEVRRVGLSGLEPLTSALSGRFGPPEHAKRRRRVAVNSRPDKAQR